MFAVSKGLESFPCDVRDCRVDVQVDSQVALEAWSGRGLRSHELTQVAKHIFDLVTQRHISLAMFYVPSKSNPAEWFSRKLSRSDSMLSPLCWNMVQSEFAGVGGHNLDLMALDSNTHLDKSGSLLRHFTPYPTPLSPGVNVFNQDLSICDCVVVNAYVFPPISLIFPLLRFLQSEKVVVTLVVPRISPLPIWWPILNVMAARKVLLAKRGSRKVLLSPTKRGFSPVSLPWDLWAFRHGGEY